MMQKSNQPGDGERQSEMTTEMSQVCEHCGYDKGDHFRPSEGYWCTMWGPLKFKPKPVAEVVTRSITKPQKQIIEEMVPVWEKNFTDLCHALKKCGADFCKHERREHQDSCGCLHPGCECDTFIEVAEVVTPKEASDMKCTVANVDGSSCGLEHGRKAKHEFTVPPPDEFFVDDADTCPICREGNEWCKCGGPKRAFSGETTDSSAAPTEEEIKKNPLKVLARLLEEVGAVPVFTCPTCDTKIRNAALAAPKPDPSPQEFDEWLKQACTEEDGYSEAPPENVVYAMRLAWNAASKAPSDQMRELLRELFEHTKCPASADDNPYLSGLLGRVEAELSKATREVK